MCRSNAKVHILGDRTSFTAKMMLKTLYPKNGSNCTPIDPTGSNNNKVTSQYRYAIWHFYLNVFYRQN